MGVYIIGKIVITSKYQTFHFVLHKHVDNIFMYKIEYTINHQSLLAEDTRKNKIPQFLSKYKHGNDIHGNGKQQNE